MRINPTFGIDSINIRVSTCNTILKMLVNSKIVILLWSKSSHKSTGFTFSSHLTLNHLFSCMDTDWSSETRDGVHRRDECCVRGKSAGWDDWGVKSSGGNGAEGSQRGGEERGRDTKKLIWHICPGFPAPSATINTFTLFVLLSREMRPLRSRVGQKRQIGEGASLIKGAHRNVRYSPGYLYDGAREMRMWKSETDSHFSCRQKIGPYFFLSISAPMPVLSRAQITSQWHLKVEFFFIFSLYFYFLYSLLEKGTFLRPRENI